MDKKLKWFKHISGSLKDSLIFESIEKFGSDAYLVFFGTLELMADEFDISNPGVSRISIKKMTNFFQLSRHKTVRILEYFDSKAKEKPQENISFFATIEKDHVIINCPKLAHLSDNHTQSMMRPTTKSKQSKSEETSPQEAEAEAEAEAEVLKKSSKEQDFILPSNDEILYAAGPKTKENLSKISKQLYDEKIFPAVFAFVNKNLKEKKNPRAIIHVLGRCYLAKPKDPFAYCAKILKVENGNYNEKDNL